MPVSAPLGWQFSGKCLGYDPNLFFPFPTETVQLAVAKRICADCPVKQQCLAFALALDIPHGVWGGLGEGERRELRRSSPHATNAIEYWQVEHGTANGAQWERRHGMRVCDPCLKAEQERRQHYKDLARAQRAERIAG